MPPRRTAYDDDDMDDTNNGRITNARILGQLQSGFGSLSRRLDERVDDITDHLNRQDESIRTLEQRPHFTPDQAKELVKVADARLRHGEDVRSTRYLVIDKVTYVIPAFVALVGEHFLVPILQKLGF